MEEAFALSGIGGGHGGGGGEAKPAEFWINLPGRQAVGLTVEELTGRLAPFGIQLGTRLSISCTVFRADDGVLVKAIGEVLRRQDGSVVVCPRRDSTAVEVVTLLRAAELACREQPSETTGWERRHSDRGGVWWQHTLLITVDSRDPYCVAYRSVVNPMDVAGDESEAVAESRSG